MKCIKMSDKERVFNNSNKIFYPANMGKKELSRELIIGLSTFVKPLLDHIKIYGVNKKKKS